MKKVLKIIGITVFVIAVILFLWRVISPISPFAVHGVGMAPTYNDGDVLLVNKYIKHFSRGDVVLFKQQNGNHVIKRIIGLPLEKVEIRNSKIFINDANLHEVYNQGETLPDLSITLTNDQYFVLGDNRTSSFDSRNFGPISRSNIIAKVSRVLYHALK